MSPSIYSLHVAVLAFLFAKGYGGSTVIIPETTSVIEHAPLQLDCFYKDYGALPDTTTCRWSIVESGTTRGIARFYENCLFINYFEEIYTFECTNKTANSMIIKSTDRNMHGTVFSCSYYVDDTTATGYSTIRVIGQLPDTESLRNVIHCDISSPLNIACGTDEVIVLHSIKLAYNVFCETTCCNTYDSSHCFAGFDADITREFRRTCSGRHTCTVPSIQNTADFCSFGVKPVSYVFLQYYCIPGSRTMTICDTSKTLTSTGPPLYITSANYPDVTIGSTSCACSIEVNSCSSSITLYEADIDLYLDTSNCLQNVVFKNGTDGVLTTIGCESYYVEYITNRAINSHYSKIDFINNSPANQEGLFLLGLKVECTADQWRCTNGDCIAGNGRCDNFPHCSDDSDEQNCAFSPDCPEGLESCLQTNGSYTCVKKSVGCCGSVPVILNGAVNLSANTSVANVVCRNGYQESTPYITCLTSGEWEQATCTAIAFERTSQNSHVEVIVGTVFAVAAVTVGIMAGIFIYRKRYQKKTNSGTEAKSHDEVSEMKTISGNDSFKKEPVYEGLQPHTERGAEEPRENPYSKLKLDKDPQSTASPVYTNLTL